MSKTVLEQAVGNVLDCAYLWVAEDADKGAPENPDWENFRALVHAIPEVTSKVSDALDAMHEYALTDPGKPDLDRIQEYTEARNAQTKLDEFYRNGAPLKFVISCSTGHMHRVISELRDCASGWACDEDPDALKEEFRLLDDLLHYLVTATGQMSPALDQLASYQSNGADASDALSEATKAVQQIELLAKGKGLDSVLKEDEAEKSAPLTP